MVGKRFNVEIVEAATGKVMSVIGRNLDERRAEKREMTGFMRIDPSGYFIRRVEVKSVKPKRKPSIRRMKT